jgi:putative tryptophan/tyrosine transport system substrate-binding protein
MRRREFITLLGGAVTGWPGALHAQQSAIPTVGFISSGSPTERASLVDAFRQGETGYVEGRNVKIEYRWAEGQYDRLPALAAELVRSHVDVIAATGSLMPAQAAKAATTEIPIVFEGGGGDPVKLGLVASLNKPGGNMTGVTNIASSLDAKRLELLHEMLPNAKRIGVLLNPDISDAQTLVRDIQRATHELGEESEIIDATTVLGIDKAFQTLANRRVDAIHVASDVLFMSERNQVVTLAARYGSPTSYFFREFVAAGGLMSYGVSLPNMYRQAGVYTGRILKGAKPAELPVLEPTKFELVINLKTAKSLGLTVPQTLLVAADEVIE